MADDASAQSTAVSFVCGSFMTISLRIDDEALTINDSRFLTNGCGFMTAAAEAVCETFAGRPLADLHGLLEDELMAIVTRELGSLPSARSHCATVVFEALRGAFAGYRRSRVEEFQGEKALICTCFGVSEETVVGVIEREGAEDVDDVARLCRAGSGCGSCRMLIEELIDTHRTAGGAN